MKQIYWIILLWLFCIGVANAQFYSSEERPIKNKWIDNIQYNVSTQISLSNNKTPLWLNANEYGVSSLDKVNGHLRLSAIRSLKTDSAYKWGVGYGVDIVLPYHYTSKFMLQQAFVEGRWWHGALTIGSKQYPLELKNNSLSSGGLTLGKNALPIPQVRLAIPEYWRLPFGRGWLHIKGHIAYGKMTDSQWQTRFTNRKSKYTEGVYYHSKAGFLKIGNEEIFMPFSLELGLEMASEFGGTSYIPRQDGTMSIVKEGTTLQDFWHALLPGGADQPEKGTAYQNVSGNQLGSWLMRMNYDADRVRVGFYAEKYFEDHSSMLQLDYDGYGMGEEWMVKKKRRYLLYDFKDILLGLELNFKYNRWLQNIVMEYLYMKYQSGPIYHDHTHTIADHIGGNDDYYNHYIYTGWQHWGQVMGNPLFLSPIYNDGVISVRNNRFKAFHLGLNGSPIDRFSYKCLVTWQDGLGTYSHPYFKRKHSVSVLLKSSYTFKNNWQLTGSVGADIGNIRGHNVGCQITLSKTGIIK